MYVYHWSSILQLANWSSQAYHVMFSTLQSYPFSYCYLTPIKSYLLILKPCADADKQMAINVFLGVYQPGEGTPDIWDLPTDYYLHHTMARVLPSYHAMPNHTKWWDSELIAGLPLPLYRGMYPNVEVCGGLPLPLYRGVYPNVEVWWWVTLITVQRYVEVCGGLPLPLYRGMYPNVEVCGGLTLPLYRGMYPNVEVCGGLPLPLYRGMYPNVEVCGGLPLPLYRGNYLMYSIPKC